MILIKLRQLLCRICLFLLGWKNPDIWFDLRREHSKIIVVIPEVNSYDIIIYYLMYWGYFSYSDRVYIWKNVEGWDWSNSILRYMLKSLPYIPCARNINQPNTSKLNSVSRTYKILEDFDDWALIVSKSGWSRRQSSYSGYYYLALALHADIVSLELNRYTK